MKNAILVVSNNASRTGAPILLLNLLKWIKRNSQYHFIFILRSGGELLKEYKSIGEVFLEESIKSPIDKRSGFKNFFRKILKTVLNYDDEFYTNIFIKDLNRNYHIQLIFSNTLINGDIVKNLKRIIVAKIVTYVHEGERLLEINNSNGLIDLGLQLSDIVIAVSYTVKQYLINKFNLSIPIQVIPGAIDNKRRDINVDKSLLEKYHIPLKTVKIMACGYPVWQKGIDFFIQIAGKLGKIQNNVHFIWLGGHENDEGFSQLIYDIRKLNLFDKVTIIPNKHNAINYINLTDIILVLSRDESFSLVAIEAGFLKKPILCFEGTGGPCEIVDFQSRFIVPYADIEMMCERINLLIENPSLYSEMGEYLYKKVMTNYTVEKSARDLLQVLNKSIEV